LEKDLELTDHSMSYDGTAATRAAVSIRNNPGADVPSTTAAAWPVGQTGAPDFEKMTKEQRRAYDQDRLTRKFG
jgi:hypothetical protein